MVLAALAAAASLSSCTPVRGADRLWNSPAIRFVMVGETHGTREAPELFADLVCEAARSRPVIVALEQDTSEQPAIDAFLRSSGDAASRSEFLKAPMWNSPLRDGRSSQAMLRLLDQLRIWKQERRIAGVVAFRAVPSFVPGADLNDLINRGMADVLGQAATDPKALLVAYGGSTHMSLADVSEGIHSAAGRLTRAQARTVLIDGAGSAWNCFNSQCAAHPKQSFTNLCKTAREILFSTAVPGFDAVACVGKPFTASPPAVPLPNK